MCDGKVVAKHVDDRIKVFFVNYVLVAKEGHVGGILGVDKQVVGNRSTTVAINNCVDHAPHSKVCTV
jgi:hypothetical protein